MVEVLHDIEWRIAPGERTGILGRNGAGKSTLLALVDGSLAPSAGRVKTGKTVRVRRLSQQLDELDPFTGERVSDMIGRLRTAYRVGDTELAPGQLLERLGFPSAQLSSRVGELSGGWRRRLQLLLVLLDEPNVLILDEPTNDLDTDMLTAMEDVLDSWPGTLLVVSHDRYLIERVTDQQYAVTDGHFRHLPGGVEQYLTLRKGITDASASNSVTKTATAAKPKLGGAELRNAQKEFAAAERKIAKLTEQIAGVHLRLAEHDQSDYAGLGVLTAEVQAFESTLATTEERWLELSELLN
jgi:ABC-type multidrug transport system ATPase subunit